MRPAALAALALSVVAALGPAGCRPDLPDAQPGSDTDTGIGRRLELYFDDLHRRGLFDGAVVAGRGSRVLWAGGYGHANFELGTPFTPETPADAGSLAKTFTATLLVEAAREGRLDLDAPARRLLPELPYPEVTLRHLISHTSGLPVPDYDFFDPYLPAGEVRTTERLLGVLAEHGPALHFPPGTAFEYSSLAFDLAALAAARAAGRSYGELLEERYFRPLGIAGAFLRPGRLADFPGVRTLGHRRVDGRLEPHDIFDGEAFHGGSNLYLSALGLYRWNASFLDPALIDAGDLAVALEPARIGGAPSGITLGSWYRAPHGSAYWYDGHLQGFHCSVFRDLRSAASIAFVSNNTVEPWLPPVLIRAVAAVLAGGEAPPAAAPDTVEIDHYALDALAGRWRLDDGEALTLATTARGLEVESAGVSYRAFRVGPWAFYTPGLDLVLGFSGGPAGEPAGIHVSSKLAERRGARE